MEGHNLRHFQRIFSPSTVQGPKAARGIEIQKIVKGRPRERTSCIQKTYPRITAFIHAPFTDYASSLVQLFAQVRVSGERGIVRSMTGICSLGCRV